MLGGKEAANGDQAGLGTRVRAAIRRAGINHSEVARSIGLEPSKLSKSLAGTRKFRVEEITRIAELTDVTTDWLTRGQGGGAASAVDHLRLRRSHGRCGRGIIEEH
ncbi:helix-turn-helix domain-containing protein [Brevibacterium casei]|uniref:helix-turn-helix domain-containing protein n=1 Tax=Brevibacterium casei TaxID=33889 RepID=UPI003F7EF4E6